MIVAAAVYWNGLVISLPPPARHHNILHAMHFSLTEFYGGQEIQGFLTNEGVFVNRTEAMEIAKEANQLLGTPYRSTELFSEDLW